MRSLVFQYASKKVECFQSGAWNYEGIDSKNVAIINPSLYDAINILVKSKIVDWETEEKRTYEEQQRIEKERLENERLELQRTISALIRPDIKLSVYARKSFELEKESVRISAEYKDTVYSGRSFYGSTTDKPWRINYEYKTTCRQKTIEKAVSYMIKKLDEEVIIRQERIKRQNEATEKENKAREILKESGIIFENNYNGKEAKIDIDNNTTLRGSVNSDNCAIYSLKISGSYTPEQFKQIAEFIKNLKGEN